MIPLLKWLKNCMSGNDSRKTVSQTARLALILRTGKLRIWVYRPSVRRYFLLSEEGACEREYNPVEFSQLFNREDFENIRTAIYDICENRKETEKVLLHSATPEGGPTYEVTLSVSKRDSHGHVLTVLGIQRDMTEELRRQEKANQLLMRYHTVFDSALLDMLFYDKHGVLTDINERACMAFNVPSREMVLNGHFLLENNPMYNGFPLEKMENTRASSIIDFADFSDEKYKLDDFQLHGKMYYESAINPIRDEHGELEGIYMAGHNISEMVESYHRQQAGTRQLRDATKSIKEYISNINYALSVSDVQLVNYYPQSYTFEMSNNATQSQMRLSQLRCIRLATPRFRRVVNSVLNRMDRRSQHTIVQNIETEIRDQKGRQIWLHFNLVPMKGRDGQVERYFGICRNITDLVETEGRLAVETKKAQETELLKQAFLTNMSYEIRTPLNTIVGFAELFAADHDEADEPFFVEQIKRSTNSLLLLVNDILFLSRLDANMIEYKKEDTDIAQCFDTHCQLGLSAIRPEVQSVISHPYDSLVVDIDEENLGLVIERLCAVSCRSTQQGFIKASYEYRRGELTISIEDTGEGISPDMLKHVFERFVRNEDDEICGTGLDLPIVQLLVQQMGGSIDIESEKGKGTTVWISIPCTAKTAVKRRDQHINTTEQTLL